MAEQQIAKLVGSIVEHQSAFAAMSSDDAQWAIQNTKAAITLFITAVENRHDGQVELATLPSGVPASVLQPLLTLLGAVKIRPASKFVARDFFKINTKNGAPTKISYVGDNFKAWFLAKTEKRTEGKTALRCHTLNKGSADGHIIDQLGGKAKAKTSLAEIVCFMQKQANGEGGALHTNGYTNIFYVCDAEGVLRAVFVSWGVDGWCVRASSVENQRGWNAGCRVFSRDS